MTARGAGDAAMRFGAGLGEDQASALRRMVESAPAGAGAAGARALCRTVAIASGKGGVGKTTLSVNLCVALADREIRTALLDADLGLANADVMCGMSVRSHLGHVLSGERSLADIVMEAPGGFRLIPGASGVGAIADLDEARLERLLLAMGEVERSSDALVIDCGAGIGRGVMSFLSAADLAVIVATPEPTSIAGAYATLKCLLGRAGAGAAERVAVFVNQARSADEAEQVRSRLALVSKRFLGVEVSSLGWAPLDAAAGDAIRARRPLMLERPRSHAASAIRAAAVEASRRLGVGDDRRGARSSFVRRLLGL